MHVGKLTLTALFAFCLVVVSGQPAHSQDKEAAYTVTIKKVAVQKTKADGSAWDINNGAPDLCVMVRNVDDKGSKTWKSATRDDVYEAEFNTPTDVRFRQGQTVEFEVVDVDVAINDSIGKKSVEMTAETIKKGTMKLEKFGQVIYLEIEIKKL